MPRLSHRNNSDPPDISKLMAKNGLDNGVHFKERINVFACRRVATRNVNQHIAVDQVSHASNYDFMEEASATKIAPKIANILGPITEIGSIFPHAVTQSPEQSRISL